MLAFASSCCLFAKSSLDSSGCCGAPNAIPVPSPVAKAPANAVLGFFCTNSDTPVPILDKPSVAKYFIPDFKDLEGNAKITLFFRDYPANANSTPSTTPPLITGPFTITSSTDKVDTRVRGRQVSLKIENDALDETGRYGTIRLDSEAGRRR